MPIAPLPHRALIQVTGEDAEHLLEGLVTSRLPEDGQVVGSALLTPQGKLLFTFLISRTENGFLLECDAGERQALLQRLTLYKLRAKVELSPIDMSVFATFGDGSAGGLTDTRHDTMGGRHYGAVDTDADGAAYTAHRIALGVLEGPDEVLANTDFPHDVALDLTGAVSFTKGCFVGQEVVSRVRHRGTARRRPILVEGETVQAGATLTSAERDIGTVRAAVDGAGIAVVRLDHIKQSVTLAQTPVALALPPYATYSLSADETA